MRMKRLAIGVLRERGFETLAMLVAVLLFSAPDRRP